MGLKSVIVMNLKIIKAINSCERSQYTPLLDEILDMPESKMWKVFTKKYYLWNIMRGKDFYKSLAQYAVDKLSSRKDTDMNKGDLAIRIGIKTANKDKDRKVFVKSIQRVVPILTIDTLRYTSTERIEQMLSDPEGVIADDKIRIIFNYVSDLKSQMSALQSIVE